MVLGIPNAARDSKPQWALTFHTSCVIVGNIMLDKTNHMVKRKLVREGTDQDSTFSAELVDSANGIWSWIILCGGGCPVHCRVFTSILGSYLPDASNNCLHTPQVMTPKRVYGHCQWPRGGKIAFGWGSLVYRDIWTRCKSLSVINATISTYNNSCSTSAYILCYVGNLIFWGCADYLYWHMCFWKAVLWLRDSALVFRAWYYLWFWLLDLDFASVKWTLFIRKY